MSHMSHMSHPRTRGLGKVGAAVVGALLALAIVAAVASVQQYVNRSVVVESSETTTTVPLPASEPARGPTMGNDAKPAAPLPPPPPPPPTSTTSSVPDPRERATEQALDVVIALASGDLEKAQSLAEKLAKLDPTDPRFRAMAAEVERRAREARKNQEAGNHVEGALGFLQGRDYDRAAAEYGKALEIDPTHPSAMMGTIVVEALKQRTTITATGTSLTERERPARVFLETTTRWAPSPGSVTGTPSGFVPDGFEGKRAATHASVPAQILLEVVPHDARPGEPYILRLRLYNEGYTPLAIETVELVSTFGDHPPTGRGQLLQPRLKLASAKSILLLHEVWGIWTESQSTGSIDVGVGLGRGDKLTKTVSWKQSSLEK